MTDEEQGERIGPAGGEHGPRPVRVSASDRLELDEEAYVAWAEHDCEDPECPSETHVRVHLILRIRSADPDKEDGVVKEVRLELTPLEAFRMGTELEAAAAERPFLAW